MSSASGSGTPYSCSKMAQETLADHANTMHSINEDLQRQCAAYGHFREVLQHLDNIAAGGPADGAQQLPFIIVRFPQKGAVPGEMKIDMNTLQDDVLAEFRPIFDLLARGAGENMLAAWENVGNVLEAVQPIVNAARQHNPGAGGSTG